jgi:translocation and assembly module TamB
VVLVAALVGILRYGVLLPQARLLIAAQASGINIGRFGRLHVEGLEGDIWSHFTLRRLTIADDAGVWVEAQGLDVTWSLPELFGRKLHVSNLVARQLTLIRRPTLRPAGVDRGLPVSFQLDRIRTPVEMRPAFSYRRGVYRLDMTLNVARTGAAVGRARADSLMHAGDFVDLRFDLGRGSSIQLEAHAREANGGAVAGSLGLAADQPFSLDASATGTMSQGRFTLDSRSGERVPLRASGAWTPQGGQAAGEMLLQSSSLLQRLTRMFGPSARFQIAGWRTPDGLYDLNAHVVAQNLTFTTAGKADIGRRLTGPQGLALNLSIAQLSRLSSWPQMGSGRAAGRLVGTAARWTFTGNATISNASTLGMSLASISGPVTVARQGRDTLINANVAGAGGRGSGILAALLGARPAAQIASTMTGDGRLLLRRVTIQGPGLSVDGNGQRGILGDLSFAGTARLSNFAFAHSGATGLVNLTWTARQARGSDPWSFTADARGERFAAGLGELDRLLGSAPRFQVAGALDGNGVALTRASLDGQAGSVSGTGRVTGQGGLGLALDWRARGPFRAGPVEMSGDIHGDGRVSGTLLHPRADLNARLANIDMPVLPLRDARVTLSFLRGEGNIDGLISVNATSQYGPARGAAAFNFRGDGVSLTNVDVDAAGVAASGSVTLSRGRPSLADLSYTIGPGVLLVSGAASGDAHIADSSAGPTGRITLTAANAVTRGGFAARQLSVEANGPLNRMALNLSGQSAQAGLWRAAGDGILAVNNGSFDLALNLAGRLQRADFRTREAAQIHWAGDTRTARLRLAIGGGAADIDVTQARGAMNARAVLQDTDLALVNEDLAGRFNANVSLTGRGRALSGELVANLMDARAAGSRDPARINANIRARLAGDQIVLDAQAQDGDGLRSQANLVLPAEASADPFRIAIARTRPMRGTFRAQGEVAPLWILLMGGERSLGGQVDISLQLAGTLADPRATGVATLANGRFQDSSTGLRLTNLGLRATLANSAIDVADLQGTDGSRGRVTGSGRISLLRNGVSSFRLDLEGFRLLDNDIGEVSASGEATVNRDAQGRVQLSGDLTIDRAEIAANPRTPAGVVTMAVVEVNRPERETIPEWERPRGEPLSVALNVQLRARRSVFVRGRGLNLELSVDSRIGGTSANPTLTGIARVVRGDYDLGGRRFQFDNRGTITLSTRLDQIRLDLTAVREDPSLTATITVSGTAARPRIALGSVPALPQDEVLARVLFGTSAAQLSPFDAAQLASSLAALAGGGGLDVIGNLRSLANLDRLAIGGTQVTGVTVSGGRYITDNVYLELTGGGREGPSAQVEWRVRRSLSIISRLRGQGDASLSIRWRRDY